MATVNNTKSFELQEVARPIHGDKKKGDTEAALAHLSALIEEVLESIPADTAVNSKIVHPNFNASGANPSSGPSDDEMEKAYVLLIGLLAELQGSKAKYANTIANDNAAVGKAFMKEMEAQFNETIKKLNEIAKEQAHASFWSKFTKWIEGIAAAIGVVVATLCGQPALALVILTFTTLSLSGGMEKITKGIADLISKDLVKQGYTKEQADKIAKVIADILVIVVTIVATVVTCGAGAAGAAAETVEAGAGAAEEVVAEAVAEIAEEGQSSFQKLFTFLSENNPFAKLSQTTNFALLTGSMAAGSTNFGHDIMDAAVVKMTETEAKASLSTAMSIILGILTAIVGAGAGLAVAAGSEAESAFSNTLKNIITKLKTLLEAQEFKLSTALKALMAIQIAGDIAQFSGQVATGAVNIELANTTKDQGDTQSFLSILQSLNRLNDQLSSTNAKALGPEMRSSASDIATLSEKLNDLGRAVARELQA